jgi:hypothetical protein
VIALAEFRRSDNFRSEDEPKRFRRSERRVGPGVWMTSKIASACQEGTRSGTQNLDLRHGMNGIGTVCADSKGAQV